VKTIFCISIVMLALSGASCASTTQPEIRSSFEGVSGVFSQRLVVDFIDERRIDFRIVLRKDGLVVAEQEGRATLRPGDNEVAADENGEAVFLQQFEWRQDECWIDIQIEADLGKRAIVSFGGCDRLSVVPSDEILMRKM
jgi:hypothetical protein